MRHRSRLMTSLVLGVLLSLAATRAAAFDPGDIPADAKWYVHVDVTRLVESPLAQRVMERRNVGPDSQKVARLEHWAGFHPLRDVEQVLIFHNGFIDPEAVVVLRGDFSPERIGERAQLAPAYEAVEVAGEAAHRFQLKARGGPRMVHAVVRDSWLAMSADEVSLAEAVRVLTDRAPGLGAGASLVAPEVEGAWLQAGAVSFDRMRPRHSIATDALDALHLVLAESNDRVELQAEITATSAEEATQMADALRGLKAMVQLRHEPEAPARRVAEALTIEHEDRRLNLRWDESTARTLQLLDHLPDEWDRLRR